MAQVLMIDQRKRTRLLELRTYAETNPIKAEPLRLMAQGRLDPVGDSSLFSTDIPVGYRVVFSVEEQPMGFCRHLSVSVKRHGKLPNPVALEEIMKYLGFHGGIAACKVWVENQVAINVLQPMVKLNEPSFDV